jgi:hypothetical protein
MAGLGSTEVRWIEGAGCGARGPHASTVVRLARALRVDPGWLLVGDSDE